MEGKWMNRRIQVLLSLSVILMISSPVSRSLMQTFSKVVATNADESTPFPTATDSASSSPYPTATYSPSLAAAIANGECINSFSTFAYEGPRDRSEPRTPPLSPWRVESIIPPEYFNGYDSSISFVYATLTRSINEHPEIWISGQLYGDSFGAKSIVIIYSPDSQKWESISGDIGDTGLHVQNLFVTRDGTIWGQTAWNSLYRHPSVENAPVLNRFNENTQRFEPAAGALEISISLEPNYQDMTRIVLDQQGIFWIFAGNDGIYAYNPSSQTIEKRTSLPDFQVGYTALSPDGTIYFQKYQETGFRLLQDSLFQFFPNTGEIVSVHIPDEYWPPSSGMIVDHAGRLWLGSIGYRDTDGTWHLIHPHPQEYVDHEGQSLWGTPYLMLESSDGILWYSKNLDSAVWVQGTAWYDPATGEGCLFTNLPANNIVEDSEHQLWLVADGKLYKYSLNS